MSYKNVVVLDVDGIDDTLREMTKYSASVNDGLRKIVDKYGKLIKAQAKANAPVNKGTLKASIKMKKFFKGLAAHIMPSDEYMKKAYKSGKVSGRQTYRHFVEYGTGERYTKGYLWHGTTYRGRANAHWYMSNARKKYEGAYEAEIARLVNKEVKI